MSYVDAKTAIGYFCAHGMCGDQDYEEAFKWYKEASNEGSGEASFNIGYLYASGALSEEDIDEAIKWWRLSAEQGYEPAEQALSPMSEE